MLYQFDKNMLINADSKNGLNLIEGLVSYDFIIMNTSNNISSSSVINNQPIMRGKWLNLMKENILKVKELLSEDGAIAIHVNNDDYTTLRGVMDDVFGEQHYINTFVLNHVSENQKEQSNKESLTKKAFEFIIVYQKSDQFYYKNPIKKVIENQNDGFWTSFKSRVDRPTMRYAIEGIEIEEGHWRWSKERSLRALNNYYTYQEGFETEQSLKSYWNSFKDKYFKETGADLEFVRRNKNSMQYWINPSEVIFMNSNLTSCDNPGKEDYEFNTAKNIISIFTNNTSKVLDFNAGSEKTAEAIMTLNAEDGGSRQFTLIANDKKQLCTNICKPRIDEVSKIYNEDYQYFVVA